MKLCTRWHATRYVNYVRRLHKRRLFPVRALEISPITQKKEGQSRLKESFPLHLPFSVGLEMDLPPEHISIKRRRQEEPVELLCEHLQSSNALFGKF